MLGEVGVDVEVCEGFAGGGVDGVGVDVEGAGADFGVVFAFFAGGVCEGVAVPLLGWSGGRGWFGCSGGWTFGGLWVLRGCG